MVVAETKSHSALFWAALLENVRQANKVDSD